MLALFIDYDSNLLIFS